MKDRSVYRDLFNKIEINYPVSEWIHNGYYIWPILRIRLFLMMVRQYEGSRHVNKNTKGKLKQIFQQSKNIPKVWFNYYTLKKDINVLYCGASAYRVDYFGMRYNRYFDFLMDKSPADNLLVEYSGDSKDNYYKPERVLLVSNLIKSFRVYEKIKDVAGRKNNYVVELNSILKDLGFEINRFVSDTSRQITNVDRAIYFFDKLLRKISPQKVYELCYYSTDMLGLNIAADRLSIPTMDMQHGPYHLAYWSWNKVPQEGYEALPNEFHTWDKSSAKGVRQWAQNTTKHSVEVTGNPWVEGWKSGEFESSGYPWPDNLILYTLQPTGEPLKPYLLKAIKKTCNQWNWWLRLHPRQAGELADIENKLRQNNLLHKVNITDATNLPLPEILINTNVHITKFSGCAIEAFSFGTPTIILDKRGVEIFKDYFSYEIMKSCTDKDSDILSRQIKSYI